MNLAKDVQTLSHRLHPDWIDFLGIGDAVDALCRQVSRQSGMEIVCQVEKVPEGLSKGTALCLHRVLQEALQNAIRHSGSERLEVSLRVMPAEIEMTVRDFGIGFDPGARAYHGLGLTSMKERLKAVGGELSIRSQAHGTTIQANVPIVQTEAKTPGP